MTVGTHRWMRNRWSRTLPALALVVAATVPAAIASATAATASTPPPYQLTGGLPAESSTSTHAVGGAGPRSSSSSPAARRGRGGSQGFQRGRSRPTRCFPISCDPREQETICTAVAAGAVVTVGTRGDVGLPAASPDYCN